MRRPKKLIMDTVAEAIIDNISSRVILWRARYCTSGIGYVLVILA